MQHNAAAGASTTGSGRYEVVFDLLLAVLTSFLQVDAVVSTLGGTLQDFAVDSIGNINVIETAKKYGVKKFVLVTSIGCGKSRGALSPEAAKVRRRRLSADWRRGVSAPIWDHHAVALADARTCAR